MKARTIKKLRKKIQSKDYLKKRIKKLDRICKAWDDFLIYYCDEYFANDEDREENFKKYQINALRIEKKCNWYKQRLENNN